MIKHRSSLQYTVDALFSVYVLDMRPILLWNISITVNLNRIIIIVNLLFIYVYCKYLFI